MSKLTVILRKRYFLFLLFCWLVNWQNSLQAGNTFFIVHQNDMPHQKIDTLTLSPVTRVGNLLIFRDSDQTQTVFKGKPFSCKFLPLAEPMDSILQAVFHSSRALNSGAFLMQFDEKCQVDLISKPVFITTPLPLKELNLVISEKIIQDEIYIDVNIHSLLNQQSYDFRQILFFEYLFQKFLQDRIARGRAYSESVFSVLTEEYRPVYEPELHIYLDETSVIELIEKWSKIKTAFKKYVYSDNFSPLAREFTKKIQLIQKQEYNYLIGLSKLFSRYGYFDSFEQIQFTPEQVNLQLLRQNISEIANHLIVLWFKPGLLDAAMLESLKEATQQNLLILQ